MHAEKNTSGTAFENDATTHGNVNEMNAKERDEAHFREALELNFEPPVVTRPPHIPAVLGRVLICARRA